MKKRYAFLVYNNNTNQKTKYLQIKSPQTQQMQQTSQDTMIVVKQECPEHIIQKLTNNRYQHWSGIISKNWQLQGMTYITCFIYQWNHNDILQFYANQYDKIYMDIKHIYFPFLKYMNTWGNNIQSIQSLSTIYWPNLQQICLWDNNIVSVTPFRRIIAPKLNWIDLKGNNILDHSSLSQFYTPTKKLLRLHVTTYTCPNCILKMQAQQGTDVRVQQKNPKHQSFIQISVNKRNFKGH